MKDHNHPQKKQVINRLSKAIGHLESVKKMSEDGRDCSDILIQLSAVISALQGARKQIIEGHINHCVADAAKQGDSAVIHELLDALNKYMGIQLKDLDSVN